MLVDCTLLKLIKDHSHNDLAMLRGWQEMRVFMFIIYLLNSTTSVAVRLVVSVGERS